VTLFKIFERRSIENPAVPLTDLSLLSLLGGTTTDSGIAVTERTAHVMSAVYRATALVSGLAGALPLQVVGETDKQPITNTLLADPHPDMTDLEIWRMNAAHRCLWGNGYTQKIYNKRGVVVELWPITPDRVTPGRARPTTANPSGKVFKVIDDSGQAVPMTSREIMHTTAWGNDPVCGISPVRAAAQAVGVSLAAEKYGAKLFGSGNLMSGLLQTDAKLTQQQAESLQRRWAEKVGGLDNAHKVAVLDAGAKFQSMTMPNDDAELLASRDFQVTELCRFFGVPPYLMFQTEKTTSWGSGLEQQARGFTQFDLHPIWLAPLEKRITKELLEPGQIARYDMSQLMRGDSIARAEYYRVMWELGAFNANEIRGYEDLPPRDGGDRYQEPMAQITNTSPLGTDPVLGGSSLGPSGST
jgi:HK97 family phage portal protein